MTLQEKKTSSRPISNSEIENFFYRRDFTKANFKGGKNIFVANYYGGESTSVKLTPRPDFTTFYKSAAQGGVIVFEYSLAKATLEYACYSPIWLFGIWTRKIPFKENPSLIFKYLKEGYLIQQEFIALVKKNPS